VELNRKAGEDVWRIEEKIYKGTGVSSTRLREKDEDRSRYIRLCHRRSFIYGV